MARKSTKADMIIKMLAEGFTALQIKKRMKVSESYVHAIKKKLAEKTPVENDDDVVRPRLVGPHKVKRVTKAEAEAIKAKAEEFIQADTNVDTNVDAILDTRASNYGSFLGLAQVTQRLKTVAHQFAGQHNKTFDADQAEALDLIFTKIGRILNGDPNYVDSWTDIAGYATLVADRLQGKIR